MLSICKYGPESQTILHVNKYIRIHPTTNTVEYPVFPVNIDVISIVLEYILSFLQQKSPHNLVIDCQFPVYPE